MISAYSNKISFNKISELSYNCCKGVPSILLRRPINGQYKLTKKLGNGSFGEVYAAKDISTSEGEVSFERISILTEYPTQSYYVSLFKLNEKHSTFYMLINND